MLPIDNVTSLRKIFKYIVHFSNARPMPHTFEAKGGGRGDGIIANVVWSE